MKWLWKGHISVWPAPNLNPSRAVFALLACASLAFVMPGVRVNAVWSSDDHAEDADGSGAVKPLSIGPSPTFARGGCSAQAYAFSVFLPFLSSGQGTSGPTPTATVCPTTTAAPTFTPTPPSAPSATFTPTHTPTAVPSATSMMTLTIPPTSTATPTATASPTPTATATATAIVCGNGTVDAGEMCDDQDNFDGDGCSALCEIEYGFGCLGEPSVCETTCGDSVIAGGEQCDQGNVTDGDGCSSRCLVEPGYVCTGEPSVCETTLVRLAAVLYTPVKPGRPIDRP